jgi:2-C-methyl-D-erythritol 4-phosphate cytidylyltransferase
MRVAALVVAAGRGERLGHPLPKAFVPLAGRPLLLHALGALAEVPSIDCIVPVLAAADLGRWRELEPAWRRIPRLAPAVAGGAERQDSVRAGLEALGADFEWVAVHDAARPLVRPEAVARVIEAARAEGAAILAVPVCDTIKRVQAGRILDTPSRSQLCAAQTPQVFRAALLREALAKAGAEGFRGTDDAELVERLGVRVRVVEGDPQNLKITDPPDLEAAAQWLARRVAPEDPT